MLSQPSLFVLVLFSAINVAIVRGRRFTVTNKCSYTVWPGVYTGNTANGKPDGVAAQGGWRLNAGSSSTFNVPDTWASARVWGRTGCDFGKPDVQSCATGSCIGGLHCTQPGIPPVTLAEFTLNPNGKDNYDVSNVDGFNVPVSITAAGCAKADCSKNLNPSCPAKLQVKSAGKIVGCKSACLAIGGDSNCCTGSHNTRPTCPTSGVQYYSYFHGGCPNAYAYAYDDSIALKTCAGNKHSVYTVTFCP